MYGNCKLRQWGMSSGAMVILALSGARCLSIIESKRWSLRTLDKTKLYLQGKVGS